MGEAPVEQPKSGHCGTCRWWWGVFARNRSGQSPANSHGECRRHPPVMLKYGANELFRYDETFPSTTQYTWCGEWEYGTGEVGRPVKLKEPADA